LSNTPVAAIEWVYIDTTTDLKEFCATLRAQFETQPWIAVDTEFMREKTYYPQLALLQIGTTEAIACIDPLVLDNLDPILDIIFDNNITKVFHAAHQDMEIFYHLRGSVPAPVFDTQVAAPLLGHPNQMGYGALVEATLGTALSKGHARTNWLHRPLSSDQLNYAADDVRYLACVYLTLKQQLTEIARLNWLDEDFKRLTDASRYTCEPEQAWKRIRAGKRLRGKSRAILKALAAWREEQARRKNLPRNWLLRDDMLIDLAKLAPQSEQDLKQLRGISDKQGHTFTNELLPLIRSASTQPQTVAAEPPPPKRPTPAQDILIEGLMAGVQIQAQINNMHPSILASRKDVEQWLLLPRGESELMTGWRHDMIGIHLPALLDGRKYLKVEDGQLQLVAAN